MQVEIYGGAGSSPCAAAIGAANVIRAEAFFAGLGVVPTVVDTGGAVPRRIVFTATRSHLLLLRRAADGRVFESERDLADPDTRSRAGETVA